MKVSALLAAALAACEQPDCTKPAGHPGMHRGYHHGTWCSWIEVDPDMDEREDIVDALAWLGRGEEE